LIKRDSSIKALEWIPVVPADQKARIESAARAEGFKDFKFVERSKNGDLVEVGKRVVYYPVFFVEPMQGNESVFGFDLGSSPDRRKALDVARDTGQIATSETIRLVQNGQAAVLLFAPVYIKGMPTNTIELRRKNIAGFALGVFEVEKMIGAAFSHSANVDTPAGIDFYIFDANQSAADPFIYLHPSRKRGNGKAPVLSSKEAQEGPHVTHKVEVGDRNWLIVARPIEATYNASTPQAAWAFLLLGLVLSGTLAVFMKSNINQNEVVESLVVERTAELTEKTEQIELMHDVTVIANEADSIERATKTCVDLICKSSNWKVGHAYFLANDNSQTLIPTDIWYVDDEDIYKNFIEMTMQTEYGLDAGLPGRVLAKREPIWMGAVEISVKTERRIEGELLELTSSIGVPIMIGKDVVGVLEFYYTDPAGPDNSQMQSLAHIGAQLGRVFERKKVENMKSEFISTVSHELRTPLTSIKGSLGLIVSGVTGKLSGNLSEMVNIAYNNSDRLVRLINDILDIEKIEVGKMEFNMEVLDLGQLMERIVAENQGFVSECNVNLKLKNFTPDARIFGDSDRITQAVTNLISNAAKFSPENSDVEIDVTAQNHMLHIAVSDKGPGISEEFRSRIFGKFAQADSASGQGGTGLGLSISKAIVEEHSGVIGFESEVGEGATFYIQLPKHYEAKDGLLAANRIAPNAPRVLVCENDHDISKLLELMLSKDGLKVDVVYNAADAKQALLEHEYAAMTLDLGLPDQDGISLLQEIRQNEATRDLPIVVVSAKAVEGKNELNGNAFGIVDWIQKPIDQEHLNLALLSAIRTGLKSKPHILHIEDDKDVAMVVSTLVADIATVTLATGYEQGKDLLLSENFDLVVLDLMLPDGAGEDLLALAQNTDEEMPPFIVFSAKEISTSAISDGIKAALVKSLTSNDQLLTTIRAAIDKT
jgi:signal transduction histidine kinase/DNA-binding response OmpR family regulator/CHASE1-domain containing sensor protein